MGIGPTETLAKVANYAAKKRPGYAGVCDLREAGTRAALLPTIPVDEVWGVGGASAGHRPASCSGWGSRNPEGTPLNALGAQPLNVRSTCVELAMHENDGWNGAFQPTQEHRTMVTKKLNFWSVCLLNLVACKRS